MIIDSKLLWKDHISQKKNELNNRFRQLFWLLGRQSKLSTQNKLLIYKTIIAPIWKYGVEIWGTASTTNLKIIQRVQSKILRTIVNAEWYIRDEDIHRDLNVKTVKEVVRDSSLKHTIRLVQHSNRELRQLPVKETLAPRRLKRYVPSELVNRY
ncbi:Probable RNA-directed DNA polymerase from transposon X-element [Eumeta japonica]|uniref:Probable RNA-directed DNA polymerase from transposon X-element n=1 Tax=Eumeta variegata TaxID=151549 RepID=A0A4C1TAI6_EUMVA|nr:Probable RNA-directed DNA polymerase from transposon X-element [Eumeta japonica]